MTNQVQARTIALLYCNASYEPQKDNTHATVDHDSIRQTLYGIVMVNFTLVTCSSHSICLVSTTFSNKSTILTLFLICLLPVCYIHLITCLSDQTLDSFLSPPIDSWWNWGARWAWQLPTENLHVPSARHDWDYHRRSEVCQTCRKPAASCLDLHMPSTSSIPQNWCILLRYIRGSLWDWTPCVLSHHPSMQISSPSCLRWFLWHCLPSFEKNSITLIGEFTKYHVL